jgi:hypothetical protein
VEEMLGSGLATLQQVEVVRHVAGD